MLTIQYRMHEHIMAWSSAELYKGRLRADPYDNAVAGHELNI
jgi:superfamily I DNA and/or RNA helicase